MMKNYPPLVITIVGPESSGKTTLAEQLAGALGSRWVPEYARVYLENLDRPYVFEDLREIAMGQLAGIQSAVGSLQSTVGSPQWAIRSGHSADGLDELIHQLEAMNREIIIVDSGLLSIRMWAKIKYGKTVDVVEEAMSQDLTSLYILKRPVREWVPDVLREAPMLIDRAWIYNQYLGELRREQFPFLPL